jgi:hypothetical protein
MDKCRVTNNNKIYVFAENQSKLTIENPKALTSTRIVVDGCEINDTGIKCDFMLLPPSEEFYIELKGQDIEHALKQIERTMQLLSSDLKNAIKRSYIICSRSPLNSTAIQNFQFLFKKKFNSKLIIKSSPFTDKY